MSDSPTETGKAPAGLFRGVAKHSLVYGFGVLAARAVSFIMLPIYARALTPEDFGVMYLIEMSLDLLAIIGGANLALGVFRYYHKVDGEDSKHAVVSTSFLLVGILYSTIGAITFAAADFVSTLLFESAEHAGIIRIASVNLAASALLIVPMALARVKDHSTVFVGANLAKLCLMVLLNVVFLIVMNMGVAGIFLSSLIANGLVGTVLAIWAVGRVGTTFSRKWLGDLVRYGGPLVATNVATFVVAFSDRYFLQVLSTEAVVGLYGLAYQFGFLLFSVGFQPFYMVWGPKRFEIARSDDRDHLLSRGFLLASLLLLTAALGIVLFVGDALRILMTPEYYSAAAVVPLLLVAFVFQAWSNMQDIGILVRERTAYLTLANFISAAVALTAYALLIPRYLEWGAAIGTVLALATRYAFTYAFSQRLWFVQYEWRPVLTLVVWAVTIAGVSLGLSPQDILPSLATRTGLLAVYLVGLWLLPVLDEADRDTARRAILEARARLARRAL